MSDLNRDLAPISDEGWEFIAEEAKEVLNIKLAGRKVADFVGPKGLDYAALNTGKRVKIEGPTSNADYYKRQVLPLVEVEVPFTLKRDDIKALVRGAEDVDSDDLQAAANKVAQIENDAIFYGLDDPAIEGIVEASEHAPIEVKEQGLVESVAKGISKLAGDGVEGPYNLALGLKLRTLMYTANDQGYPIEKRLKGLTGGDIVIAPNLGTQGLLIPNRGEDFEFIVGRDLSVGYKDHDEEEIEFYFTESFTFRVNAPEAAVVLE